MDLSRDSVFISFSFRTSLQLGWGVQHPNPIPCYPLHQGSSCTNVFQFLHSFLSQKRPAFSIVSRKASMRVLSWIRSCRTLASAATSSRTGVLGATHWHDISGFPICLPLARFGIHDTFWLLWEDGLFICLSIHLRRRRLGSTSGTVSSQLSVGVSGNFFFGCFCNIRCYQGVGTDGRHDFPGFNGVLDRKDGPSRLALMFMDEWSVLERGARTGKREGSSIFSGYGSCRTRR